jgi:transposase
VAVERVERVSCDGGPVRLVHLTTVARSAAACPACGVMSTSVKQYRTTRPRDLPYGEERLQVRWHKRQYRCQEAACSRKAFTESVPEAPRRARLTGRLCRKAAAEVASGRSVSCCGGGVRGELAGDPPAQCCARRSAADRARSAGGAGDRRDPPRRAEVVHDAETGRWVRTERFETNFIDASGTGRLPGQVAGRTGRTVTAWMDDRGQACKDQVTFVAMDPCAFNRSAVQRALPHAVIVVDHPHLVRLASQAVTRVRQRVTRQVLGRRRLLRARERLTQEQFNRMWEEISAQEATGELLAAWIAKEELRYLLSLARTHAARSEISNRLFAFHDWCARADVPELTRLARTIEAWWPQIVAFIDTGIINARTVATNQQNGQGCRPDRIRVPQPRKPAPPGTVALQADDHQSADARVTSPLNFEEPFIGARFDGPRPRLRPSDETHGLSRSLTDPVVGVASILPPGSEPERQSPGSRASPRSSYHGGIAPRPSRRRVAGMLALPESGGAGLRSG